MKLAIIGYGRLWKDIEERIVNLAIKNVKLIGMKKNVFEYLYYAEVYLYTSLYLFCIRVHKEV